MSRRTREGHSTTAAVLLEVGILELAGDPYVCLEVERVTPGRGRLGERWTVVVQAEQLAQVIEAASLIALRRRFGPDAEPS